MKKYRIVEGILDSFNVEKRYLLFFWECQTYFNSIEEAKFAIDNWKIPKRKLRKKIICYR